MAFFFFKHFFQRVLNSKAFDKYLAYMFFENRSTLYFERNTFSKMAFVTNSIYSRCDKKIVDDATDDGHLFYVYENMLWDIIIFR